MAVESTGIRPVDLPRLIRDQTFDLERRFSGPIPRAARLQATLPTPGELLKSHDIDECIAYFTWLCVNRARQLRWAARWAIASRGQSGLTAIIDRERFQIACRRLQEARRARDAWLSERDAAHA